MKMRPVAAAMRNAISHSSRWSRIFIAMAPLLDPARVEARFLVDRLDEILADARLVLLVDLDQGLLPRLLLFGREGDELRLAALLHRGERVLVLFPGDVVGVLGGVRHRAFERLADVGRK